MDTDAELAELEKAVYSRAGSAETPVEGTDPGTGQTVRATPSEFRLRALRAERAGKAAGRGAPDRLPRLPDAGSAGVGPSAMPARAHGQIGAPRRRLVLPLVAAAAFAAGIVAALVLTSIQGGFAAPGTAGTPVASESAGLLIFDLPPRYPDIPVPHLGDQFVPDSIRNISGTGASEDGFGVYLGRETDSGLYCLIVHTDAELSVSSCSSAGDVARQGLRVQAAVTVLAPVSATGPFGDTVVTAVLSPRGKFSMSFPPPGEEPAAEPLPTSLAPPATPGTVLGTATNGPDASGDFQGSFDAHGEGLIIALDCVGEGTVTVDLSDGSSMQFVCNAIGVENLQNTVGIANESVDVTVFTTGDVVWGLTIASTPLAEPVQG